MSWYKMTKHSKIVTAEVYCPKCGATMKLRKGPYGEFYGCSNYPGCKGLVNLVDAPKNQVPKAPMPRPNQPQVQQPQNQPPNAAVQPIARKTWFLATMLDGGIPVVVAKKGNYWEYMKEDGTGAEIPAAEIAKVVKSVADDRGQKISGEVPAILFKKFRELNNQVGGDEGAKAEEAVAEDPNKVQGRIPAERISPQQKEIEESFLNTPQSIMINALAGSGKTTMLRHLASFKDPNQKWLYLVFNKKNQVEASTGKGKFPNGVEVKTSHSFLGQVLGRSAELGAVQFTDLWNQGGERIAIMADTMLDGDNTFPNSVKYAAKQTIKQVASLAKAFAVHPKSQTAATDIDSIITKYSIDTDLTTNNAKPADNAQTFKPQIIDKVLDLLYYCLPGNCNVPQCEGMRDHDDTLWYSAISPDVKFPKYDVVLADEVQAFNTCQTIMLQKLAEAGARIVAVGDPNQAIYMFRGADAQAFSKVQGVLGNAPNGNVPHELPVNYRSGRNIIQYVNQKTKVKNLVAGRDFDGQVTEGTKAEDALGGIANEKARTGRLSAQTAFLARTNAPLVNTALSLMKSNVDFVIIGRDFSKELIDHLKKVVGSGRNSRRVPIQQLGQVLDSFYTETEAKWRNKISKEAELKDMKAVTEALGNIVGHLEANGFTDRGLNMRVTDSEPFINFIKSKFAGVNIDDAGEAEKLRNKDPLSYVTLTSAHRSKGLEFDRVYILEPNLFPHPKSKTPDALDQEENAKYVAFTRAMKQLHVLAPSEDKKKKGREVDASTKKKKTRKGWYIKAKGKKAK